MKVSDLFYIYQGNSLELINMEISSDSDINFVSRTSENNGVIAKVCEIRNRVPFKSGLITVALGGSVLSTFVQKKKFYTSFHIMVLEPKRYMTINEKLFYSLCITRNNYRYSYGRQANKTLKDLNLPDTVPDWVNEVNVSEIKTEIAKIDLPLDSSNWKNFNIVRMWEKVYRGERQKAENRETGSIRYFSASEANNALTDKISNPTFTDSDALIYTIFGDCYYVEGIFTACDDVSIFKHNKLNKYNGLFIATIISKNRYKYRFGRKAFKNKFSNEIIKLPTTATGDPDWDFMENYIKSLPFSDCI